jgi:hypothetical protein
MENVHPKAIPFKRSPSLRLRFCSFICLLHHQMRSKYPVTNISAMMDSSNTTTQSLGASSAEKRILQGNCRSNEDGSSFLGSANIEMEVDDLTLKKKNKFRPRVPESFQIDYLELNRQHDESIPLMQRLALLKRRLFQRKSQEKKDNTALRKRTQPEKPLGSISIDTAAHSSVLASLLHQKPTLPLPVILPPPPLIDPQAHLDQILASRGYATNRFSALDTAYYSTPTPLQEASYSAHLIHLVRSNNVVELQRIMSSGIISTNPCNSYGESLLHTVCRRGHAQLLKVMLESATRIQVCDDFGRTPFHDACWTLEPCFEVITLLLEHDPYLVHMVDLRGSTALSYVQRSSWAAWKNYIDANVDKFWPVNGGFEIPSFLKEEPNSRPLLERCSGNLEVATMVAKGKLTPEEALLVLQGDEDSVLSTDDVEDDDKSDSDSDDDDADDDHHVDSWEEDEELVLMVENHMRFV